MPSNASDGDPVLCFAVSVLSLRSLTPNRTNILIKISKISRLVTKALRMRKIIKTKQTFIALIQCLLLTEFEIQFKSGSQK